MDLTRLAFVEDDLELPDYRGFFLLIRLIFKSLFFLLRCRTSALVVDPLDPGLAPLSIKLAKRLHNHALLELPAPLLIQSSPLPLLGNSSQPLEDLSVDQHRYSRKYDVKVALILE